MNYRMPEGNREDALELVFEIHDGLDAGTLGEVPRLAEPVVKPQL